MSDTDIAELPDYGAVSPRLSEVYKSVADAPPDEAGKVLRLSKKTGQPPEYIHDDLGAYERAAAAPNADQWGKLEKSHPRTSSFLTDPEKMSVSYDDVSNIASHEDHVRHATTMKDLIDSFNIGYEGGSTYLAMRAAAFRNVPVEERGKFPTRQLPPDSPTSQRLAAQVGGLVSDAPTMFLGALGGGRFGGGIGASMGAFALPKAFNEALKQSYDKGDIKGATDLMDRATKVVEEGSKGAFVGAAVGLTGGAAGAALEGSALAGGRVASGLILGSEGTAMTAAGALSEGRLPTAQDWLDNFVLLLGMHGATKLADMTHSQYIEKKHVEAEQNFYRAMGDTAEASKLRERLPEAHKQLIQDLTQGSRVSDVYVPVEAWEKYFQGKNIDPHDAAKQFGVEGAYAEAKSTGESVKVPLATWTDKLVGTPHYKALAGDVKFDPEGLTPNQIVDRNAATRDQMQEEQAKAEGMIAADAKMKEAHDTILEEQKKQLGDSGYLVGDKSRDKVIEASSKAIAAHYLTEGIRRSVDPVALYRSEFGGYVGHEQVGADALQQVGVDSPRNVTGEAIPSSKLGHKINSAAPAVRSEFTQRAMSLIKDLPAKLGVQGEAVEGTGGYARGINPNVITGIKPSLSPAKDIASVRAYARALQFIFKQDAVPWFQALPEGAEGGQQAMMLTFKEPLTPEREHALFQDLQGALTEKAGYTKLNDREIAVVNYGDYTPEEFNAGLDKLDPERHGFTGQQFSSVGEYGPEHDWSADQKGLGILGDPSLAGSSDLQGWLHDRQADFDQLLKEYSDGQSKLGGRGDRQGSDAGPLRAREEIAGLEGLPGSSPGPTPEVLKIAGARRPARYVKADPERGSRIAAEYERLKHEPDSPEVQRAYKALIDETVQQYRRAVEKLGLKIEPIKEGMENPYPNGSKDMISDVRAGHVWFFPTELGFGSMAETADHPMLQPTAIKLDGKPLLANDVFRIVHDIYGHVKEGVGFGPDGEENAWQSHSRMYSPEAQRALATETRGQNSWVNFGPKGEANRSNPKATVYADQKAGLLPEWVSQEGMVEDAKKASADRIPLVDEQALMDRNPDITRDANLIHRIVRDVKQPKLNQIAAAIAENNGAQFIGREKSVRSIVGKVVRKDSIDYNVLSPKDLARGTVIADDVGSLVEIAKQLKEQGLQIETFIDKPLNKFGYRNFHGSIDLGDGIRGEVQFHTPEAKKIKDVTDEIYRKWRGVADQDITSWGPEKIGEYEADMRQSRKLWSDYWDKIPAETKAAISDLSKGLESVTAPSFSEAGRSQDLRAGSNTSGLESASQSSLPLGSRERSSASAAEGRTFSSDSISSSSSDTVPERQGAVKGALPPDVSASLRDKFQAPLRQGERGFYDAQKKVIALMRTADPSTGMHEWSHLWLESAFQYVKSGAADEAYLKHWEDARDWLGVKDDQTKLTVEQQEKFASGFERYLMEGESPSAGLRGVFSNFRKWLTDVYRSVRSLPDINDKARAFFDRMLASDDQITSATRESGYSPDIAELPDADPKDRARVRTLQERARETAINTLLKEQMSELRGENSKILEQRRAELTGTASAEVGAVPVYAARTELRGLIDGTEKQVANAAQKVFEGSANDKTLAAFEQAAEIHGFADAADLAKNIVQSMSPEEAINARVEAGMLKELHLKNEQVIADMAREAIHNKHSSDLLALEQVILEGMGRKKEIGQEVAKRSRAEASVAAKAARDQAQAILGDRNLRDASAFRSYFTAEKNAAVRVSKAIADGDYAEAAKAKRQQLLNHALASEALKNKAEIGRKMDYLKGFAKRGGDLKKMPFGFTTQIDNLLARHQLGEAMAPEQSMTKIADDMATNGRSAADIGNATGLVRDGSEWRPETLREFVARVNEDYYPLQLPGSIINAPEGPLRQAPRDMTLSQLRDLHEAVKSISGVGRGYERFLNDFMRGDIKANARALADHLLQNVGRPYGDVPVFGNVQTGFIASAIEKIKSIPDSMIGSKVNLLTLSEFLDLKRGEDGHFGPDPSGPAKENIYRPLDHADKQENLMRKDAVARMDAIRKRHYSDEELKDFKKPMMSWQVGDKTVNLTKENVINLLLHQGSESNLDRVLKGFNIDEARLRSVTDQLTEKDTRFVQDTWDFVDTFWPHVKALEMDVNGVEPTKVQPRSVDTPFGKLKGGYYPLSYDFTKSLDALKNAEERGALYKQFSPASAHTEQGFLKARVNNLSRPLDLTFDGLFRHLDDVIHDLSYRRSVIDVSRFLNDESAKGAIVDAIGMDGYKKIQDDLKAVAGAQGDYLSGFDSWVRWFRFKANFVTLAYRATIFPIRLGDDVMNSMREVGPMRSTSATVDYIRNPQATRDFVTENSIIMRERGLTRERDLIDMSNEWKGKQSLFQHWAFLHDTLADQAMSYPTWMASYQKFLPELGHERAVQLADESIVKTFGSGRQLERVGAQRGSELNRLASSYYSWWSMMFNRAWLQGKIAGLEYHEGNIGRAMAISASTAATTAFVPAMNKLLWSELLRNNPDGEADPEDRHKRVVAHMVAAPFAVFPWGRQIGDYIGAKVAGEHNSKPITIGPAETAFNDLMQGAWKGVEPLLDPEKEYDKKGVEQIARGAAVASGTPQSLVNMSMNFADWLNDDGELTWRDAISRRKKK